LHNTDKLEMGREIAREKRIAELRASAGEELAAARMELLQSAALIRSSSHHESTRG